MNIPLPLIAAAVIVLVLLLWLALRGRDPRKDLVAPPVFPEHVHPPPPPTNRSAPTTGLSPLPPEAEAEIRELLRGRRKIEAIKRLRRIRPMSLREAKDFVERM